MEFVYVKTELMNSWVAKYFPTKDLVSIDELLGVIEDLDSEVQELKAKLEESENDKLENYKPIPVSEKVGVSDRDFY